MKLHHIQGNPPSDTRDSVCTRLCSKCCVDVLLCWDGLVGFLVLGTRIRVGCKVKDHGERVFVTIVVQLAMQCNAWYLEVETRGNATVNLQARYSSFRRWGGLDWLYPLRCL